MACASCGSDIPVTASGICPRCGSLSIGGWIGADAPTMGVRVLREASAMVAYSSIQADNQALVPSPQDVPVASSGLFALDAGGTMVTPVVPAGTDDGRTLVTPSIPIDTGADQTTTTPLSAPQPVTSSRPPSLAGGDAGPLAVGQAFGARYLVIKVLGLGGMGAVYQAWDAELGQAVALKLIRPETTSDPAAAREMERRFKQELVLARQVTHKNVVRIHDLGEINGIKYITMPYLDGSDLSTILKKEGKLPVPRALRIVRDVAAGLQAAHEAGIVHRDLKPANIMLVGDQAIIMDFGIARAANQQPHVPAPGLALNHFATAAVAVLEATMAGAVLGTVAYMAPEQAKGEHVDQRADLYALGLIFSDMLLGRRRMSDGSAVDELNRRIEQAPSPVRTVDPAISEAVERIISRCLEPDPAARFQTSTELVTELDRLDENGEPIPIRRVVGMRLMAAVVALLLGLAGGLWWYQRQFIPVAPHDPVSVVIADFKNGTGDTVFNGTLEPMLRRALEDAAFITAYDRGRINGLGVQPPERLDEIAAREIAVKQGVGVVVSGSLEPQRSGYRISVKAIQSVTGDVISSAYDDAASKNQVLEVATRLVARVRSALGDKTSESAQLFAMRSISTSSLEVVNVYAAGVEAQARGNFEDARQRLLKTVELDPTFALGYHGLAVMSQNLLRPDDAKKYIGQALRYLDGLTDREKYTTRGFYFRLMGDNQQCVREYGELLARYPADVAAHNQRAICLKNLRRIREAIGELRQAVQVLPKYVAFRTNLALYSNFGGDFDGAEREVESIAQPSRSVLLAQAQSLLGRGRLQEATEAYEKLARTDVRGASLSPSGLGDLLLYQGRYSDAIRVFEQGAESDLAAKNLDRAAIKFTSIGYAHLMTGQAGRARAIAAAERALMYSRSPHVLFPAAQVLVEAGALNRVPALAAEISSSPDVWGGTPAHGKIIEGEAALKSGDFQQAIKLLTDANSILDTWIGHFDLGRAYLKANAFVQADAEFDRCIARRGEALSLMDEDPTYGHFPIVYYYQGQVRQQLNTAGFADSFREYLKVRGASGDDPLLPEVRRLIGS
jgi:eukaryotic-like serine/threonine-protein kinase